MSLKRIFVVLLQVVKSILQGKLLMRLGAEKWFCLLYTSPSPRD